MVDDGPSGKAGAITLPERMDASIGECAKRAWSSIGGEKVSWASRSGAPVMLRLSADGLAERVLEGRLMGAGDTSLAILLPMFVHSGTEGVLLVGRGGADSTAFRVTIGSAAHARGRCHVCAVIPNAQSGIGVLQMLGVEQASEDRQKSTAAHQARVSRAASGPTQGASGEGAGEPPGGSVLLLDDDVSFQRLLSAHLSKDGVTVTAVTTVAEGVARVKSAPFDLALVDLDVASESGETFVEAARRAGFRRPVVAVSGIEDLRRLGDLYSIGVNDILRKPIDEGDLRGLVRNHLLGLPFVVGGGPIKPAPFVAGEESGRFVQAAARRVEAVSRLIEEGQHEQAAIELTRLGDDASRYGFAVFAQAVRDAALVASSSAAREMLPVAMLWLTELVGRLEARGEDALAA